MATSALNGEAVAPPQNGSNAKNQRRATRSAFLSIEELAQWLGIEEGFVRRLIAQRRIPFVKIGKLVRFDPDEMAIWIDGQRVQPERRSQRRANWRD
jgi:excisionase family DNA binding protein